MVFFTRKSKLDELLTSGYIGRLHFLHSTSHLSFGGLWILPSLYQTSKNYSRIMEKNLYELVFKTAETVSALPQTWIQLILFIQTIFFQERNRRNKKETEDQEETERLRLLIEPLLGSQANLHPMLHIFWNHHQENFEVLVSEDKFTSRKKPKQ